VNVVLVSLCGRFVAVLVCGRFGLLLCLWPFWMYAALITVKDSSVKSEYEVVQTNHERRTVGKYGQNPSVIVLPRIFSQSIITFHNAR